MNFIEKYKSGKEGKNLGLSTGLSVLDKAINGIQRKAMYGVGAGPKVGKTTLVDYCFVLSPYLKNPDVDIEWIYYSFEIDRVRKEFKYASFFFYYDYKITQFSLPDNRKYMGSNTVEMNPNYLMGKMKDDDDNPIKVSKEHEEILKVIYENRIIPLFGEYNSQGKRLKKGKIDFIEDRDNPTGLRNYLFSYAKSQGDFLTESYKTQDDFGKPIEKKRIMGYKTKPEYEDKFTIVITDHIRKLRTERGYTLKQNVDKWIEYQVELRNWVGFTFVNIVHLNRNISSVERSKYLQEFLYPTGDDTKDTGNLSEEADFFLTMFNANDEKYKLDKHFGLKLREGSMKLYPNYRSIHVVESRDTVCPKHLKTNMYGGTNHFEHIHTQN